MSLSHTHTLHPAYRKSGCLLIIPISIQRSDAVRTATGQLILFDFHHRHILLTPDPAGPPAVAAAPTAPHTPTAAGESIMTAGPHSGAGDHSNAPPAEALAPTSAPAHPSGTRILAQLQPREPERHYHDIAYYHGTITGPDFTLSVHPGHPFRRRSILVRSTHPHAIAEPETDLLRTAISGDHWGLFGHISFQRGSGRHPSLILRHSPGFEALALITGSLLLTTAILSAAD